MQGYISAISISTKKGVPKSNISNAVLIAEHGIEGDAHAGAWHRQVSFLAEESIDKMRASGLPDLQAGNFAENITTKGLDLLQLVVGSRLTIGEHAVLEITQLGKECHSRCAIFQQVGDCVMPREGIFARVLVGGPIAPGDIITIV